MRVTRAADPGDARWPREEFYMATSRALGRGRYGIGPTPQAARADLRRGRREEHRRGPAVGFRTAQLFRDLAAREENR